MPEELTERLARVEVCYINQDKIICEISSDLKQIRDNHLEHLRSDIAKVKEDIVAIPSKIAESIKTDFVSKSEFKPVKEIVDKVIWLILSTVVIAGLGFFVIDKLFK